MKRIAQVLGVCAGLVMSGTAIGQVGDQPAPAGGGRANRFGQPGPAGRLMFMPMQQYQNQYADMERLLNLTDEQKPKVKEAVDAMNAELDDFSQNVMSAMRGGGRAGGANGGPMQRGENFTVRQDEMRVKQVEMQKLIDAHELKIDGLLSAEQRVLWDTHRLSQMVETRIGMLGLSEEQKEKVKGDVESAGKSLAAVSDLKDVPVVEGKLVKKILVEILTEEQASQFLTMGLGSPSVMSFGPVRRAVPGGPAPGGGPAN